MYVLGLFLRKDPAYVINKILICLIYASVCALIHGGEACIYGDKIDGVTLRGVICDLIR